MNKVISLAGVMIFATILLSACNSDNDGNNVVKDVDGNTYPTIQIGSQIWMQKNLEVTRYRNGDPIPQVQDPTEWSSMPIGAWCYYQNDTANGVIYGKLYNGYAVNDPRGLAPEGWHIPNETEWNSLFNSVGSVITAGGKMKTTMNWNSPNTGATNSSGFTCLPSGGRDYDGTFSGGQGNYSYMWGSDIDHLWFYALTYDSEIVYKNSSSIGTYGFSVRCIKD